MHPLLMTRGELLAYIAGILDGDGYISLMKSLTAQALPYYQAKVGVVQLWPGEALRLIGKSLGGTVFGPTHRDGQRPTVRWEIWNKRAAIIICRLLPHLRVKLRQAQLLLEAQRILDTHAAGERRQAKLENIRITIKKLNRGQEGDGENSVEGSSLKPIGKPRNDRGSDATILPCLAGIMDSDGNFKIERKRRVKRMVNPFYRIAIRASQVHPSPAIEVFAERFGGNVRVRKSGGVGHRPLAYWSLYDASAEPAIAALLPYLVIKAPEARLLLRLRELKAQPKRGMTEWAHPNRWHRAVRMRKRCCSTAQVQEFERLYLTLRALHAGVAPLNLPGFPEHRRGRLRDEELALLCSP